MAEITAQMVKELREKSGAGMMDCKKALAEAAGDFDKAMALLRERGEAIAVKRGGRTAKEGLIKAAVSGDAKQGALIELNCESDFVARNDDFQALLEKLTQHTLANAEGTDINASELDGQVVSEIVKEAIGKIGENIVLSRAVKVDSKDGVVVSYIHPPGKIGVLVDIKTAAAGSDENIQTLGRGIAMHIAASNPLYLNPEEVPTDALEAEKDIFRKQALNEGKPEAIVEKIIGGRVQKYYAEVCLLEQPYALDPNKSVKDVLKESGDLSLNRFVRFQLGENAKADEGQE